MIIIIEMKALSSMNANTAKFYPLRLSMKIPQAASDQSWNRDQKRFGGETFHLESEDARRISSIRVTTLAEFARQMNAGFSQPSVAILE